ncbi:putative adhesin [Candidatus Sororendozoicomonas aggregata]|uniref:putative adhesin n=1 Tax=Candidatus Sororendozoicomonas aggregata TaxID=3073239 RepID=UPI002ED260F0
MLKKKSPLVSFQPENTQTSVLNGQLKLYTFPYRGDDVKNLILLAHGGIKREDYSYFCGLLKMHVNRRFQVPPGLFICFYAPHQTTSGIYTHKPMFAFLTDFMTAVDTPYEIIPPQASVHNYQLINAKLGGQPVVSDADINAALWQARCSAHYEKRPAPAFDIITTEPSWPDCTTLKETIDTLIFTGHFYSKIHCLICRYVFGSEVVRHDFIQGNASFE